VFKHLKGFISNSEAQLENSKLSFSVAGFFFRQRKASRGLASGVGFLWS